MGESVSCSQRGAPLSQSDLSKSHQLLPWALSSFLVLNQLVLANVLITPLTRVTNPSQGICELHYFGMIKSTQQLNMN
jgi:hypothetical protein